MKLCTHKKYQRDCYNCWVKRLPTIKHISGKDILDFVQSIGLKEFHIKILWDLYRKELEKSIKVNYEIL